MTPSINNTALSAFGALAPLQEELTQLVEKLEEIDKAQSRASGPKARDLLENIREFEPTVTFIGQVKAGKTTLVNAMAGYPDLLPTEINPWTSVVTSLHLTAQTAGKTDECAFRFFTNEEWENLLRYGGRLGEIADRAGAASEIEKVRQQLDELREKSRRRLGKRFELLLGQTHRYEHVSRELVRRYVCLGDDFQPEDNLFSEVTETLQNDHEGQFADITKTADITLTGASVPMPLCLQDTPGINDTFLVREQITLNGLRGSHVCVVVLSAQQALSTVDLGLVRLVSSIRARGIVIFVNRIDELSDPVAEVPNIRTGIQDTLARFGGPKDAEIIFGSGFWAQSAVADTYDALSDASTETLLRWTRENLEEALASASPQEVVWQMSGAPALGEAIAERVQAGPGNHLLQRTRAALTNLHATGQVVENLQSPRRDSLRSANLAKSEFASQIEDIKSQCKSALAADLAAAAHSFDQRAESAVETFVERALADLATHLQQHDTQEVWTYDPVGLRVLLRGAYQAFVAAATRATDARLADAANAVSACLSELVGDNTIPVTIRPEPAPPAPAAVELGGVIALDLKGSWWRRFWLKKRAKDAYVAEFKKLLLQEADALAHQIKENCVGAHCTRLERIPADFIDQQVAILFDDRTAEAPTKDVPQRPRRRPIPTRN
ncbi:MAG: dynamin family protein [Pseudomonadota bacterium]